MKKTTKFISAFMAAILCFNLVSFSAFAAEPSATETSFSAADLATYNQELADFGLNDDEIQQLQNITKKIENATTMREVDALMESYHAILESTPLAAAKTITSYSGGTLTLDYTGSLSPISNVIFTKVIYMGNKQVEFYQKGMNSPTFVTFLVDELIGKGVSVITKSVAAKIATALSVPESAVAFLIGTSVAATLFVFQNLETWDLNDAIENSSNGKVKLEYFYSTNIVFPYYQEYQNFEPWDNNKVEIPANYDYDWQSGVYDCEYLSQ